MGSAVGKIEIELTQPSLLSQASVQVIRKGVGRIADVGVMWLCGLQSVPRNPDGSLLGVGSCIPVLMAGLTNRLSRVLLEPRPIV